MAQTVISQDGLGQCNILYGLVTVNIGNDVMHTQSMTLSCQCIATNYCMSLVCKVNPYIIAIQFRYSWLDYSVGPIGIGSVRAGG